jgi:diacylglycerol kinase family enzyme
VAGFPVNREAILDDGFIDVVMVKDYGKGLLNWFKNVLQVLKLFVRGAKHLKPNSHTIIRKVKTVSIQNPDKHDYNVDGSFGGEDNINLTVLKQAVKIMANVKNKNKEDNK